MPEDSRIASGDAPVWSPTAASIRDAAVTAFLREEIAGRAGATEVSNSTALHRWSIEHPEQFWRAVWRFVGMQATGFDADAPADVVLVGGDRMAPPDPALGPRWFPAARLSFAEHLLQRRDEGEAIVSWTEQGPSRRLTYAELAEQVAAFAAFLREAGVCAGDRVVGFVPNVPEAVVAMLATASLGAIWSSCSPDFGPEGVLDRFGQIEPAVLVTGDGYRYAGKQIDSLERVASFLPSLPTVRAVVVIPHLAGESRADACPIAGAVWWQDALAAHEGAALAPERFPFDHPLYLMYSSGTTGLPKCMVHGAGGTLLQHLKELVLHTDLRRDDRIFYFTTCGWMMWNWLVSSLAVGATIVLYDGAPLIRGRRVLWDLVAAERVNIFGASAKWLALTDKEGAHPRETHDLSALRTILSTGSPLSEHSFDFVYSRVKPDVQLSSISGGTDIISCFALGDSTQPVYRGELQTRGWGMAVDVFDEAGQSVIATPGELVCTQPFPSMPVAFWNDPDGEKYRQAYFDTFPGVWRHGDWAEITAHDGVVIHGRSDATLNPGGVRIGTAEIYRQVEQMPEVIESVVIGQRIANKPGVDERLVLFVRLADGVRLDDGLKERIRTGIRDHTTPHHMPKKIIQVADIPRTRSGKITELAVREMVHGRPVKNRDALANPEALELYRDLPELR